MDLGWHGSDGRVRVGKLVRAVQELTGQAAHAQVRQGCSPDKLQRVCVKQRCILLYTKSFVYILYYTTLKPFELQALPIKEIDWGAVIPRLGAANRAISRYDGILHAIPNPDVLLAPLRTQEAVLSSAIESCSPACAVRIKREADSGPSRIGLAQLGAQLQKPSLSRPSPPR